MNLHTSNVDFKNATNNQIYTLDRKVWLWCQKFWQFSRFYGDYLAGLHSKKK